MLEVALPEDTREASPPKRTSGERQRMLAGCHSFAMAGGWGEVDRAQVWVGSRSLAAPVWMRTVSTMSYSYFLGMTNELYL